LFPGRGWERFGGERDTSFDKKIRKEWWGEKIGAGCGIPLQVVGTSRA